MTTSVPPSDREGAADLLPGLERRGLPRPEPEPVDLAIGGEPIAVRPEQHRGVPQAATLRAAVIAGGPLDDAAGVQDDPGVPRGLGHRVHHGPVDGLGALGPVPVVEAPVRPQLGQHDEVGSALVTDQGRHPLDPLGHRFGVAVAHLEDVHPHTDDFTRQGVRSGSQPVVRHI